MNAKDTIISIIRNHVATMNTAFKTNKTEYAEYLERARIELRGMLVCLKNICSANEFYGINYYETGYEFGYYDENGIWISIEK